MVSLDFLQDIVEALIYILLPANEFRCVPIRVLLRVCSKTLALLTLLFLVCLEQEVAVNIGVLPFIEMYSDPDAINQLVIKMVRHVEYGENIDG